MLTANLLLLSPLVLIATVVAVLFVRWLKLWPEGVPGFVLAPLLFSALYALLSLYAVIECFVATPARLQRQYLGAEYGDPTRLIRYESNGFQDPYQIWRYRIDDAAAASLRKRCRRGRAVDRCVLFSDQDDRWFAHVVLTNNVLEIQDGLW